MRKLFRYTVDMILASILVWVLVVFLFTDEIVFTTEPEATTGATSEETESVDIATVSDGSYTGAAGGINGPIEVEVSVENGEIIEVVILDHSETEGISDPAIEDIPTAISESNSTDVDVVSGATVSSEAIMAAVNNALGESGEEENGETTEPANNEVGYEDGTYIGRGEGHTTTIEVEVTIENGEISDIVVLDHNETEGIADGAFEEVPPAIIESNSTDVDTVSGATLASRGIIEAVDDALEQAQE